MIRHFIVNPKAGKGKSLKVVANMIAACESLGLVGGKDFFTHIPKTKEETEKIAFLYSKQAIQPNNVTIYSIGGDGTNLNVVNGIAKSGSNARVSFIAGGSGNDLVRSISPTASKINLGSVNDRYFVNVASLGLDVIALTKANHLKEIGKSLAYPRGILEAIRKYRAIDLIINEECVPTTLIAICNGRFYGSGIGIAPKAVIDDDLFDVYHFGGLNSRLEATMEFAKIIFNKHTVSKNVTYNLTNEIVVRSNIPIDCNIDGEIFEDDKFTFKIYDRKINLFPYEEDPVYQLIKKKTSHTD